MKQKLENPPEQRSMSRSPEEVEMKLVSRIKRERTGIKGLERELGDKRIWLAGVRLSLRKSAERRKKLICESSRSASTILVVFFPRYSTCRSLLQSLRKTSPLAAGVWLRDFTLQLISVQVSNRLINCLSPNSVRDLRPICLLSAARQSLKRQRPE